MRRPTVLLLSTSDTDLIAARSSTAAYRWANPARLVDGELAGLLAGADLVVIRILGGYRAWPEGIDACVASGLPVVVVSGEQAPDAELMARSTVPAGIALQAHVYLAEGGRTDYPFMLFGEELWFGSECARLGLTVRYLPSARLRHTEHVATGRRRRGAVARVKYESLRWWARRARQLGW